jgi:hypothetical protein
MVTGYTWYPDPPPDFHAVFEAYLEHRWIMFDATQLAPLSDFARLATGKDASETAFATLFGPVKMLDYRPDVTLLPSIAIPPANISMPRTIAGPVQPVGPGETPRGNRAIRLVADA